MNYSISYFCDQGTPLKGNQDRVLVNGEIIRDGIRHLTGVQKAVGFVADGIGSLENSDKAAQFILEKLALLGLEPSRELLLDTLSTENAKLVNLNQNDPEFFHSGTTLCGLVLSEDEVFTLNVGDSEVLLLREGILSLLTDHQVLDDSKPNSPITSFLGTSQTGMEAVIGERYTRYRSGDLLLITTDGLRKVFTNKELTELLESSEPLAQRAEKIFKLLKSKPAPDNLGAILIQSEEI